MADIISNRDALGNQQNAVSCDFSRNYSIFASFEILPEHVPYHLVDFRALTGLLHVGDASTLATTLGRASASSSPCRPSVRPQVKGFAVGISKSGQDLNL